MSNRAYQDCQVCHHPPVSAFHAESAEKEFLFHGAIYPKVKFWGKSIEFQPKGVLTVELPLTGEMFTWSNVNCVVHNIIVGTLWMEHTGRIVYFSPHRVMVIFVIVQEPWR